MPQVQIVDKSGADPKKWKLVPMMVTPAARTLLKKLAAKRHRKMYQQFAWMMEQFAGLGDVANMSVPVRLVEKLTRVAQAFNRSPMDQFEWMIDQELRKREDLIHRIERGKTNTADLPRLELVIGGPEDEDHRQAAGHGA